MTPGTGADGLPGGSKAKRGGSTFLRAALAASLILLVVLVVPSLPVTSYLHPGRIQQWLAAAGDLAPIALMGMMATAVVVSPIPSLPLDIAAGAFFGPWLGTLYAVLGAWVGAMFSFLIARVLGRELIERFLSGHINFCRECSDQLLTRIVFVSRLLPMISFDIVSYGAGLTRMSLGMFGLATLLGMVPLTFLYVYFGSAIIASRSLTVALASVFVALFFVIPVWIERYDFLSMRRHFRHDA